MDNHTTTAIATKRQNDYASQSMITGSQIRAARALLGWTSDHLAAQAGVSYGTISKIEQHDGVPPVKATTLAEIGSALEAGGIVFLSRGDIRDGGPGVRLR
jgi:transcriptional regulator with XRE-family HTH domain